MLFPYVSTYTDPAKHVECTPDVDVTDNYDITLMRLHSDPLDEKDFVFYSFGSWTWNFSLTLSLSLPSSLPLPLSPLSLPPSPPPFLPPLTPYLPLPPSLPIQHMVTAADVIERVHSELDTGEKDFFSLFFFFDLFPIVCKYC